MQQTIPLDKIVEEQDEIIITKVKEQWETDNLENTCKLKRNTTVTKKK